MKSFDFERYLQWTGYSAITGIMAGFGATAFLVLLKISTEYRQAHPAIIFGLPLAGFAIGWIYHLYGKDIDRGNNLILDEIHDPKSVVPLRMAPTILLTTILTHLFGGSAGREGTAVQIGASLSDQLSKIFPFSKEERKILLVSGAGAGFGAAIGTPFAGVLFGMEVIRIGRLRPFAVFECAVASFCAYGVTQFFHAPHSIFPAYFGPVFQPIYLLVVAVASLLFAFLARAFVSLTHAIEQINHRFISYPPLKPVIGGVILVLLYRFCAWENYEGLGIETIQESFYHSLTFSVPMIKILVTAITLAAGFKGGEFIPLVFIGATAGSALSGISPIGADSGLVSVLASVGFAAVFGAASNTPLTCIVMAIELFGWKIAPYAALGCYLTYLASGNLSIYRSQLKGEKKLNFTFISK
jgi:H+/Cl- antiporter ClcA